MARETLNDLAGFVAVARERSFTRAAARLGVSQSALSHSMRLMEERLGVRLLTRTTRSVATTEAGERLLATVGPRMDEIEEGVAELAAFRGEPAGAIRITAGEHAAATILWPAVRELMIRHLGICVEVVVDNGLVDLVVGRFDAGVRLGEQVAKDMVAVAIGPPMRMAVVGSPAYLASREAPRTPHDLVGHDCVNLRLPTVGGLYVWEFEKDGVPLKVRVEGRATFNTTAMRAGAALSGLGLAFLPEDQVAKEIASGALVRVLSEWCPPFPGYHLYYPSRRQLSPALGALVDQLRLPRRQAVSPSIVPDGVPATLRGGNEDRPPRRISRPGR